MESKSSNESFNLPNSRPSNNSKNVKFSKLRKARHSIGNCQELLQEKEKPKIIKSKSLLNELNHLKTKSNGSINLNNKSDKNPVEPIITFPDESPVEIVQKKPLKTILKNRLQSPTLPNYLFSINELPFSNVTNFSINRETEVTFPDDGQRIFFNKSLESRENFLESINCDASCSSNFGSNFDNAYLHKQKSKYLFEPRRRWSYDYIKREPSKIFNPDLDSRYLITEEKMLNSATKITENEESKIFNFFRSLAQLVYVCVTNLKYLFIFYLAAACCILAFSIKFLTYVLNSFKSISALIIYPFNFCIIYPIKQVIIKNINIRRIIRNINSLNSMKSDVSSDFLPLIGEQTESSMGQTLISKFES